MISLTFLWKNGTNIANGKFKFGELRKSEFGGEKDEILILAWIGAKC